MIYINNNKGIALIMVLLMLLVVGVLSAALLVTYSSNIKQSNSHAEQTKAFYAAESGVNYLDQYIIAFNEKEGSLGFHLPHQFDNRVEKIKDEITNIDDIEFSDFNISFNLKTNEDEDGIFMVGVIAEKDNVISKIETEYRVAPSGSSFFGHTLAAREIELENKLTIDGGYSGEDDFAKIATTEKSEASDLGWNNEWDNYNYNNDDEFKVYLRHLNNTNEMKENHENTIKFYGDTDDDFYLPETEEAVEFTELVRSVNFREVLSQNGLSNYNGVSLNSYNYSDNNELDITNINPDEIEYEKLSYYNDNGEEVFPYESRTRSYFLDELDGYFENMKEFKDDYEYNFFGDSGYKSDLGPYIYVSKFDYYDSSFLGRNRITLNDVKTLTQEGGNEVVHLYINDNLDFEGKRNDLTFTSATDDKKSVVVQSGGEEINLANGRRITYSSNSGIQGMGYYAPNATLRLSGDFTGDNISGWGHSYNVNKIKFEGDEVILPELVYDMENAGLQGNIHSDIANYFNDEDEKELENKFAGEVFRRNWKIIN